jgi:uncharacterized protein with ATP-grasp and redox domains
MRTEPDCVPCLMKRILFQARLLENGCEEKAVPAALKSFADNYGSVSNSAKLATIVHGSAYREMGFKDPYGELKIRADAVAENYAEYLKDFVENSEDRFHAAVLASIIGNVMDFGSGKAIDSPEEFGEIIDKLLSQGIESDDTPALKEAVATAKTIIYIFDNCGESRLDIILIDELKSMGKRVVGVVRGEPILNDVTMEDAKRIGLDKKLDRILTTNAFAIGMDLDRIGADLKEELSNADLIIAKGMANYESLSDEKMGIPVAYLMRSKCLPISKSLGVPEGINVVRVTSALK